MSLPPFCKTMPSGRAFDFADPRPEMICLDDIVHVLSRINRWGGNIWPVSFSVAQHSLVVASACKRPEARVYALLHDAAEAYIGDLPTPFKLFMTEAGFNIVKLEMKILYTAIFPAFGLEPPEPSLTADVHDAGQIALATEYRDIVAGRHAGWAPTAPPLKTTIKFMATPKVEEQFRQALEGVLPAFARGE
ncbi:hypothetical protein [Devosia sp. 63-57]|uniref:hypothetical protein n=1 Tax=Devosia sp. 63-57 TaxID=1895751 RepID=UPI00086D7520|nr:hypothetical protein [Devosia sp. 63-57]ODU82757.1 MAG: hypothetical protein ABT14_16570 [Pelagibacterium sp. SCN 63-17]